MMRRIVPPVAALACLPLTRSAAASDAEAVSGLANTGVGLLLIFVAIALLLTLLLRSHFTRVVGVLSGRIGRSRVRKILTGRSPDILEDFILPGAYGGLTRVDYAVLTSGGILCIQTKHYHGIVSGAKDEPQWSNVDGVRRRRFLNPLIQNEGRLRALEKVVPNVPVANLVVFTGAVQFTSPPAENVIHVRDLDTYIARIEFGPCKIDDWHAVWMTVRDAALTDEESRKDFDAQLSFS